MAPRPVSRVVLAIVAIGFVVVWAVAARTAAAAGPQLAGDALEREAHAIEAILIAPCCFSQQVSVHQSPAADQAKADIRARLAAGETRQQILAAYVDQYGTRVLAEPPATGFNVTLYVMPLLVLLVSAGVIGLVVRRFTSRTVREGAGNGNGRADADLETRLDDELSDLD